jgi:hypothetical protein
MWVTILPGFIMKLAVFACILGTHALPQWFNGLRRDSVYTPAVYNPVYGPWDGIGGYTYGGYGPQPTAVSTFSSTFSNSETLGTCVHSHTYAFNC